MDSRYNPLRAKAVKAVPTHFQHWLKGNAIAKSELGVKVTSNAVNITDKLKVEQEGFVIAKADDLTIFDGLTVASEAEAHLLFKDLVQANPELEEQLVVIPEFEAV